MAPSDNAVLQAAQSAPGWVETLNSKADEFANELHEASQSVASRTTELQTAVQDVLQELAEWTEDCASAEAELESHLAEARNEIAQTREAIEAEEEQVKKAAEELAQHVSEFEKKLQEIVEHFQQEHTEFTTAEHQMSSSLAALHGKIAEEATHVPVSISEFIAAMGTASATCEEVSTSYQHEVKDLHDHIEETIEKAQHGEGEAVEKFGEKLNSVDEETYKPSIHMAEHIGEMLEKDVIEPFRTEAEKYEPQFQQIADEMRAKIDAIGEKADEISPLHQAAHDISDVIDETLEPVHEVFDKLGVEWPGK